jgi:hypothetical protein
MILSGGVCVFSIEEEISCESEVVLFDDDEL